MLEGISCRKIAFSAADHFKDFSYKENQAYLNRQGFELISFHKDVPDINQLMHGIESRDIRIIFDCTSMSQRWYYEFFRWFGESQDRFDNVTLEVCLYTGRIYTR